MRGDSFGENEAFALALCSSGQSCVAGYSNSAMFTIKYDADGDTLWTRAYQGNGNGDNKAYAICVDNLGFIYVTGYSSDTSGMAMTTIKYNAEGVQQWVETYPGGGGSGEFKAYAITVDPLGDVFITGYGNHGVNGTDMITIKYDSSGQQKWVRNFDGPGHSRDMAYSITLTTNNDVVITGFSRRTSDTNTADYTTIKYGNTLGDRKWTRTYNGQGNGEDVAKKVVSDPSGNIYVTGYSWGGSNTGFDITTIKYNSSGNQLWLRRYDNPAHSDDIANSMALVGSSGVIVTGSSMTTTTIGSESYVTLYYDPYGNLSWPDPALFDGTGYKSISYSVAVSEQTDIVYVTGASQNDTTAASSDMVTVAYDLATGIRIDSLIYNGPTNNEDVAYDVKVDSSGNAYVTGYSASGGQHLMARLPSEIVTMKNNYSDLNKKTRPHSVYPNDFVLHQNYPNPFNPATTINFDVFNYSKVRLVVYNILGQQVATLINEFMKKGTYEVTFTSTGLSSGVYFYEMTTDHNRDVKKMVLIK